MQGLQAKPKQFKLNQLHFAIPLVSLAGLATLGVFVINQDVDYNASASNTTDINSTLSYGDQYITISNSSTIDLSSDQLSADATYIYATDNVTVSTNVPTGYELYLTSSNKESSALTATGSSDKVSATSGTGGELGTPKILDDNSYGYAVPSTLIGNNNFNTDYTSPTSSSKWAGIPAGTSDRIRSTSAAVTSGETTDVHYGANVNNALAPGQYKGSVIYSAVVTPTTGTYEMSVNPGVGMANTTITVTSGPTTINTAANLDASEIEVYFRQSGIAKGACTVTNVDASSGHLITTCTTPNLSSGNYDVAVAVPRYGFKDIKTNAFSVPFMQSSEMASACKNFSETTSVTNVSTGKLTDARNSEEYYIRKFTFGSNQYCVMVENLYLKGGTKLTNADSAVSSEYTLPASDTSGFRNATANMYNGTIRFRNVGSGNIDGSYYNWKAATAGTGGGDNEITNGTSGATEAIGSICPKGWRLPTDSESNSYIISRINSIGINTLFSNIDGSIRTPILVGTYENDKLNNAGSITKWWTSTQPNGNPYTAMFLGVSGSYLTRNNPAKHEGCSVRCLIQAAP